MKQFTEILAEERKNREKIDPKDLCSYGITALDDSCKFIFKNDLIVVGADSGAGKSELALDIATHNAQKGKRIALFYLEGGHEEAVARIKWKELCKLYFGQKDRYINNFDYISWRANLIKDDFMKQMEHQVDESFKSMKDFWIYPIHKGFTIEELYATLLGFHSLVPSSSDSPFETEGQVQLDLIIVDHLQYFELNGTEHEIMQTTKILRKLKEISDVFKVPVILISHLRKKAKDRGLPGQEDFYGSSNVVKIATTAIILSADNSKEDFSDNIYPTYLRIVKSRIGLRPNYAMRINFDLTKRRYQRQYDVFLVKDGLICGESLAPGKRPHWFNSHKYEESLQKNWHEEE